MAELMCLAECALGLLAVSRKNRKNAKSAHAQIFGSVTTKYVTTSSKNQGWITVADKPKDYFQGRITVYPYILTEEGRALLAGMPYPFLLLAKEELSLKEAAAVLGVTRSRVAQMISIGLLQATKKGHKGYITTSDLYAVWRFRRWKSLSIKPSMLPQKH